MMGFFVSTNEGKKEPVARTHRIPEERFIAARVLYESQPGATFKSVADEVGVSARSIEDRSRADGGWNKVPLLPPNGMSEAAQKVADNYAGRLEEYGPDLTPEAKHQAMVDTAVDTAISVRAQLIDRHRKEWQAIRSRAYKQLDPRSGMSEEERFNMSKTTKINAETLKILQEGERKAWGIDSVDEGKPSVVVIERD